MFSEQRNCGNTSMGHSLPERAAPQTSKTTTTSKSQNQLEIKNCAILYKTKTRIAFITLKAAFDGADERREDGKRFLANLLQKPVPLTTLGAPQPKPVAYCNADTCANRGVCLDQWTSPACDCDLTSFTGPTCTDGRPMLPRLRDFKAECSD